MIPKILCKNLAAALPEKQRYLLISKICPILHKCHCSILSFFKKKKKQKKENEENQTYSFNIICAKIMYCLPINQWIFLDRL